MFKTLFGKGGFFRGPFKFIRGKLQIEDEWQEFKSFFTPHKYKITGAFLIGTYPLYMPILDKKYEEFKLYLEEETQKAKPAHKIGESFLKEVVVDVLKDPQIKREAGLFVENLAKRQVVLDGVVKLLAQSATDPWFINETKTLGKHIANDIIHDKVVQQDIVNLLVRILKDPEFKNELMDSIKWILAQDETKKELIEMFKTSFQEPKMQEALKVILAGAFYEVLMDKETTEKLKLFSYYLLENEGDKSQQSAKSLINMVVDRVVKGYRVENKDSEFERILKSEGEQELFETIQERKRAAENDRPPNDNQSNKSYFF